jgi:hypothetical protein
LILIKIPSLDARVAEILSDPARYFADASARAWIAAKADVDADLAERTRQRLDHRKPRPGGHVLFGQAFRARPQDRLSS